MSTVAKVSNYLLGGSNRGKHPATQGSELSVNMFFEQSGNVSYMASVPGLKKVKKLGDYTTCRGVYVSSVGLSDYGGRENMFVVMDRDVIRILPNGTTSIVGQISSGADRVIFCETGGLRPFLLIADGFALWAYDLAEGGNLRQVPLPERITGEGGAIKPSHVQAIAGSIIINDVNTGFAYYSVPYPLNSETREVFQMEQDSSGKWQPKYDPNNPYKVLTKPVDSFDYMFYDNYGTVQYFNAESSSDNIVALKAVGSSLVLLGNKTIEIWQRGSGEYDTWVRSSYTTNASNGLAETYSVACVDSTLFYLGSGESYAKGVMMATPGGSYTKISDGWLEAKLLQEQSGRAICFAFAVGSHRFYVVNLPSLNETWVYDTDSKYWHQRSSRHQTTGRQIAWRPQGIAWFNGDFYAVCSDGCLYTHNEKYWYEDYADGDRLPMVRIRQGSVLVDNNRPFRFDQFSVECNVGTFEDYELSPYLLLQVSKDGGNTFGNTRQASLGKAGQYNKRVVWNNLGLNRLCVLRLTYSHPTALELTSCSQRITPTRTVI